MKVMYPTFYHYCIATSVANRNTYLIGLDQREPPNMRYVSEDNAVVG
jgi:hypothetical protein